MKTKFFQQLKHVLLGSGLLILGALICLVSKGSSGPLRKFKQNYPPRAA